MQELSIEEVLSAEGAYIGPTVGVSMLPMLKNRRDTVVIKKTTERLRPLDVALYKRDGKYVLHRVIKTVDGGYLIRGDNTYVDEWIKNEQILGILTEFFRKDKHIFCTDKKYLRYSKRRVKSYRLRRIFVLSVRKMKGLAKRILRGKQKTDKGS